MASETLNSTNTETDDTLIDNLTENKLKLILNQDSVEWRVAEDIEAQIFIESGYVGSKSELAEEYKKYLSVTEFALALKNGVPAGSMRVIPYHEGIGLKTLDDIKNGRLTLSMEGKRIISELDLNQTLEIGTLSVKKEFRSRPEDEGRLVNTLYGAVYAEAMLRHQRPFVLASYDENYFNQFKEIFGPSCHQLGPGEEYMGSVTVPVLLDIPKLHEYMDMALPTIAEAIVNAGRNMR